jgi:Flp pilus assembly protein TadG
MFAVLLPIILACYGLALDLARIYSRKAEMQAIAGTIAVAAAKKLNGTQAGITEAVAAAQDVLQQSGGDSAFWPKYGYVNTMVWSDAAIRFSKTADGSTGWLTVGEASTAPVGLNYVKVDTGQLNADYGAISMLFAPFWTSSLTVNVAHAAVAGRGRISVTPLGICAMSTAPNHFTSRNNGAGYEELVEYGFRRGVGYNLMMLNPQAGSTTGVTYLVDPITLSGSGSSPKNLLVATVSPYVCTGTMAVPRLVGQTVNVQSGFPLSSLVNQLNSRFDSYTNAACEPSTAPADKNVKQYTAGATLGWMNPKPPATSQTAATDTTVRLQTKADLPPSAVPPPNNLTATNTGPLWAYAKAVPWSAYTAGQPEPSGGYTPFPTTAATWTALYGSSVGLGTYPSPATSTPYLSLTQLPSITHRPGVANRRVLNVPLLNCSTMPGSTATVLAIGRFFMTVPANGATNTISAEFAGATSEVQAGGPVELVQ